MGLIMGLIGLFLENIALGLNKKKGNPPCDHCRLNKLPHSLVESGITVLPYAFA
jgi:hypothetical protein